MQLCGHRHLTNNPKIAGSFHTVGLLCSVLLHCIYIVPDQELKYVNTVPCIWCLCPIQGEHIISLAQHHRTRHTDPKPCYYTSETYRTVQCKKRTVPFMKRTVPCKKRTVPCKKRSVLFKKRTETFMNFFELISQTTPPKKYHWSFKI